MYIIYQGSERKSKISLYIGDANSENCDERQICYSQTEVEIVIYF